MLDLSDVVEANPPPREDPVEEVVFAPPMGYRIVGGEFRIAIGSGRRGISLGRRLV